MESFDFCAHLSLLLATQPCIYLFSLGRSYFTSYGRVKIFALSTTFAADCRHVTEVLLVRRSSISYFEIETSDLRMRVAAPQVVSRTAAAVGSGSCWLSYPSATSSRPQLLCDLG